MPALIMMSIEQRMEGEKTEKTSVLIRQFLESLVSLKHLFRCKINSTHTCPNETRTGKNIMMTEFIGEN